MTVDYKMNADRPVLSSEKAPRD